MTKNSPLLLHVPHGSIIIPEEERSRFCLPDLEDELLKMTDRYCDELFTGFDAVVFPVSRLVCDPERFRDDTQETMAQIGMGTVYTRTSSGEVLRRVTEEEREKLLRRYYDPHHTRLTEAAEEKLRKYGRCLIVDGHSFHPVPLPYEPDQEPDRPDFCIGTDAYHTPERLTDLAMSFLQREGFSVSLNRPYSGSLVPMKFYGRDRRVYSIMIEINRNLYMDMEGQRIGSFHSIHNTISALLVNLEEAEEAMEVEELAV